MIEWEQHRYGGGCNLRLAYGWLTISIEYAIICKGETPYYTISFAGKKHHAKQYGSIDEAKAAAIKLAKSVIERADNDLRNLKEG